MMTRITISILALALAGAVTGCASSSETVANNDPSRVICRTDPNTGSRLPKRVCKTALEWDQIAERNLEERRNLQRAASPDGAATGTASGSQ